MREIIMSDTDDTDFLKLIDDLSDYGKDRSHRCG